MALADSGGGPGTSLGSIAVKAAKSATKTKAVRSSGSGNSVRRSTGTRSSSSSSSSSSGRSSGRSSYSSGGGSSSSGGSSGRGRGTNNPKGIAPKPSGAGAIPDIKSYLGTDSVYQDYLRGSKRTLADYLSELGRRRGEAGTQFNDTKSSMERDRVQQLDDLKNEYASRGLINSSLYGEEQGKFQQQYMSQLDALQKQQAALLADLLSQQTNFTREQQLANERARQEAIKRRVAKYNIGG